MSSFDCTLPLEKAHTIPAAWYTQPTIAAAERSAVFGDHWIAVGRADQVAAPGEFLTAEVAGEPLLVVRGSDGILRGFFNVCRHRAARVATEPCGQATKLRCRYHGWTYDLAGSLRGAPEFEGVANFAREDNGLVPVQVAAWGHLVFAHLGQPREDLPTYLDPLPRLLEPFRLHELKFFGAKSYDLNCNWKVYVDNYLDGGYHVNTIHPSLASVLDYKAYRTDLYRNFSLQSAPLRAPEANEDASAAAVRTGQAAAYVWIYPNLMLNAYEGVLDTNLVLPLAPDRCRVIFDFYFPASDDPVVVARYRESLAVADRIQDEDVGICEDVQRGLGSRCFDVGRYSVRRENGVHHFHQLLARSLASH